VTRAVLLDIEGTIGDIAFVREVLFPFARARIPEALQAHWREPEISAVVRAAAATAARELATPEAATRQFLQWMDQDRKITPLKTLQGIVWRDGYASGELKAHLYPDAIDALRAWHQRGLSIAIYSSGSIEAQKLYFAHSVAGDLTSMLSGYFDTTTGAKSEPASYTKIARALSIPAGDLTFFSDAATETTAAQQAGLRAYRVDRTKPATFSARDGETPVIGSLAVVAGQIAA
jgi:enolase-phosphatase E1